MQAPGVVLAELAAMLTREAGRSPAESYLACCLGACTEVAAPIGTLGHAGCADQGGCYESARRCAGRAGRHANSCDG